MIYELTPHRERFYCQWSAVALTPPPPPPYCIPDESAEAIRGLLLVMESCAPLLKVHLRVWGFVTVSVALLRFVL